MAEILPPSSRVRRLSGAGLGVLAALWFAASWATLTTWPALYQDDAFWAHIPRNFVERGVTSVDFYPYAKHLLAVHVGLVHAFTVGGAQELLGPNLFAARLVPWAAGLLCSGAWFLLFRGWLGSPLRAGLLALVAATAFAWVIGTHKCRPEPTTCLLFTFGLLLATASRRRANLLGAGVLVALTIQVNLTHLVPVAAILATVVAWRHRSLRALFWFGLPLPVSVVAWLLERRWEYGSFDFLVLLAEAKSKWGEAPGGIAGRFGAFGEMFWAWILGGVARWPEFAVAVAAIPLAGWLLARAVRRRDSTAGFFAVPVLAAFGVLFAQGRPNEAYFLTVLPLMYALPPLAAGWLAPARWRRAAFWVVGCGLLAVNLAVSGKKMWGTRHSMDAAAEVGRLVRDAVPPGARLLAMEGFDLLGVQRPVVGMRDLDWSLKEMGFRDYLRRYGIRYVVDADYFELLPKEAQADVRRTLERDADVVVRRRFPALVGNTFLLGNPAGSSRRPGQPPPAPTSYELVVYRTREP